MKNYRKNLLPVLAFFVIGLASCSNDDVVKYSTNALKNTELMNILKQKGYQFDKDNKLELNDLANNTTSLDLSGTKLKDLSGLDILPNLKDVKLSNNEYGPTFDFANLPPQITGVDLTGNEIYNYKNLIDVKVKENDDETITNIHNITKLYLPAEAKYNIKDLVRFYRKNKSDIENGKIDMQMADESGKLQKYNTLRKVNNKLVLKRIKETFSSIMAADGEHVDLSKRLNNTEKAEIFSVMTDDDPSSAYLEGMQYIVENPYWEGPYLFIFGSEKQKAVIPYIELGSNVQILSFQDVDAQKGICYDSASSLYGALFRNVSGLKVLDFSHSTWFGQRDPKLEEDGPQSSQLAIGSCPDLTEIKYPKSKDLCASLIELSDLPKLKEVDLSPFRLIGDFSISLYPFKGKLVYPELRLYRSGFIKETGFVCNKEIIERPETIEFIKKYYFNCNPKHVDTTGSMMFNDRKNPNFKLIIWDLPIYQHYFN